jgi:hypothetical protein
MSSNGWMTMNDKFDTKNETYTPASSQHLMSLHTAKTVYQFHGTVFLQKIIFTQMVKKSPIFKEPERSSNFSQKPAIVPNSQPI